MPIPDQYQALANRFGLYRSAASGDGAVLSGSDLGTLLDAESITDVRGRRLFPERFFSENARGQDPALRASAVSNQFPKAVEDLVRGTTRPVVESVVEAKLTDPEDAYRQMLAAGPVSDYEDPVIVSAHTGFAQLAALVNSTSPNKYGMLAQALKDNVAPGWEDTFALATSGEGSTEYLDWLTGVEITDRETNLRASFANERGQVDNSKVLAYSAAAVTQRIMASDEPEARAVMVADMFLGENS
jgi:hypothetical protein